MTHAQTNPTPTFDILARLGQLRETLHKQRVRNLAFRKTYDELSGLTRRELDDIGVSPSQIEEIARDAARRAI